MAIAIRNGLVPEVFHRLAAENDGARETNAPGNVQNSSDDGCDLELVRRKNAKVEEEDRQFRSSKRPGEKQLGREVDLIRSAVKTGQARTQPMVIPWQSLRFRKAEVSRYAAHNQSEPLRCCERPMGIYIIKSQGGYTI